MSVPTRRFPGLRVLRFAALLLFCAALLPMPPVGAWPEYPDPARWPTTTADRFSFHVQPVATDAELPEASLFVTEFYPAFERAMGHAETVLGVSIPGPIDVDIYTNSAQFRGRVASGQIALSPHSDVILDLASNRIVVDMNALLAASPTMAEDSMRNALAQMVLVQAGNGLIPGPLRNGIALYLELPTIEYLAKLAATVETGDQQDTLLTWFDLFSLQATNEPDLVLAETYSITAFLINRYDIPALRSFLTELANGSRWQDAARTVFATDATGLEEQWRAGLAPWTASGWRDNLMASFDLQPARDLLNQGQYVSAKAVLGPAQNLYRQLGDPESLAEVQRLITQADTGIQAEALMAEVELALTSFDYPRAVNLLDQVDTQYALLPADQIPTGTLATYREIATDGSNALGQLNSASKLADSWGRYPEARAAAQDAGNTFARLGDETRHTEAVAVVDRLDNRQRRLVVLLAGLGLVTLAWLFFWLRARGASDVVWA